MSLLARRVEGGFYCLLTDFFKVARLDVLVDAHESLLERIVAAGVQHFLLDLRLLGTPGHEDKAVYGHGAFGGPLGADGGGEVEDTVAALVLVVLQLLQEVRVGSGALCRGLHIDDPFVLDVVDNVAVLLILLHLLIHSLGFMQGRNSFAETASLRCLQPEKLNLLQIKAVRNG